MKSFEEKVLDGLKTALKKSGTELKNCSVLGAAVSGGADSISLLFALKNILPENITLKAVTVNHNMRPEKETGGDADFVEKFCSSLNIYCRRYEIERGAVELKAAEEKCGPEDSARRLRYEKFNDFIETEKIDFLCLAHNKNDQEETVLMRVLQGSRELYGIPQVRNKFIRPLLAVPRCEIEKYILEKNINYRTDATNFENEMLRNRIRNILVPVLNENFNGWKKALENLAEKNFRDKETLDFYTSEAIKKINYNFIEQKEAAKKTKDAAESSSGKSLNVTFNAENYFSLQQAVKERILMKAVKAVGAEERIPQTFLLSWTDKNYAETKKTESSCGIEFSIKKGIFTVGKKMQVATEEGFFVIIEEPEIFYANGSCWTVTKNAQKICIASGQSKIELSGLDFPFAFRSRQPGDQIKTVSGSFKSLAKILEDWKVSEVLKMKDKIPVIQKMDKGSQEIKCVWGSLYGFNDFIVL